MGRKDKTALEVAIREFEEHRGYVNALHPEGDAEKLFYRTYRLAHYYRPEGYFACHICLKKDPPGSQPIYVKANQMAGHCRMEYNRANVDCDYNSCEVIFEHAEDKEQHRTYVREKRFGWWIRN